MKIESEKAEKKELSACRDGILKNHATKQYENDTTIFSHHLYILCHSANYALCLKFVCKWKAVEWVVLGVYSACCAQRASYVVSGYNFIANEHGRYVWSVLYAEAMECTSNALSVWLICVKDELFCEIHS